MFFGQSEVCLSVCIFVFSASPQMDLEQTRNGLSHTSKKNVRNDILQDGLTSSDYYWNSYAHFGMTRYRPFYEIMKF
jgi:hypothetical protein